MNIVTTICPTPTQCRWFFALLALCAFNLAVAQRSSIPGSEEDPPLLSGCYSGPAQACYSNPCDNVLIPEGKTCKICNDCSYELVDQRSSSREPPPDPNSSPDNTVNVLLKHTTHNTYLKDDGDGSVPDKQYNSLSAGANPSTDNFSWEVFNGRFGTQYKNVATGKFLKANSTTCISGPITGSGDAASWNEASVSGNTAMKNYKQNKCCRVDSADDTAISTGSCDHQNAYIAIEATF